MRRAPLVSVLALLTALALAGCGDTESDSAGDSEGSDVTPEQALEAVCDGETISDDLDFDGDLEDLGPVGETQGCSAGGEDIIEAAVYESNPESTLVTNMDGWESGDGSDVQWAVMRVPDGYLTLYTHYSYDSPEKDTTARLQPLEDQGFDLNGTNTY